jgi:hypothetical protein
MNTYKRPKIVRRSTRQYVPSILWTITGLPILWILVLNKGHLSAAMWVLLIASFVHALNLILMISRPLIKLDAANFIAYPHIFKRVVIPLNNIKCIRFHELMVNIILTSQQQKQNNTLIVDVIDGKQKSIEMFLTESVRQKLILLLRDNNIASEYIAPNKT